MKPYETHRGKAIRLANEAKSLPKAGSAEAIMGGCTCVADPHYGDCPWVSQMSLRAS